MTHEQLTEELRLLRLLLRESAALGIRSRMISQWLATGWPPAWPQLGALLAELVAAGLGDRELQPLIDFLIDAEELEQRTGMIAVAWSPPPDERDRWPGISPALRQLLQNCTRPNGGRAVLGAVRAAVAEQWLATGRPAWPQVGALLAELVTAGLGEPELRPLLDFVLEAEAIDRARSSGA